MAHRATTIANAFLKKARADQTSLSPMQIIKLVYIAHGWALALLDKPLIQDNIEAWKYGPVIPELWHEFKVFGRDPITQFADNTKGYTKILYGRDWQNEDNQNVRNITDLSHEEGEVIDAVWRSYGKMSALQLSAMTHQKETPWQKAFQQSINAPIRNEAIKSHFESLYNKENRGK